MEIGTGTTETVDRTRRIKNKSFREVEENKDAREMWKIKERLRKKKQRENKRLEKIQNANMSPLGSSPLGSYRTLNTLRKAVLKTKKTLPESPAKKEAVVRQLINEVVPGIALVKKVETVRSQAITEEVKQMIQTFYEQDDISRPSPNRKDIMSIKNIQTGIRTNIPKRHMMMSVMEAYALFTTDNPNVKIGKSKFFELRPKHVRPISEMPHNVCVCVHHANYVFLLETLRKTVPEIPSFSTDFLKQITCDTTNEECMTGECSECFDVADVLPLKGLDTMLKTTWKQWQTLENRCQIVTINGTVKELIKELSTQTPKFKRHVFVKNEQAKYFDVKKKETTLTEIVLQVDFAENFAILTQDEIQAAHWSHPQVTLFTGCAWANNGEQKHSYVIVSNELSHDKYAVWVFMKKIIEELKSQYPDLKKITVFSDGCAAQFKNRYTLSTLCYSEMDWGVKTDWNFFASSHGKGAVDGIGATAKKILWTAIMARKEIIDDSWDCYRCLTSKSNIGMHIFFVAVADIKEHHEKLHDRWQDIRPIPYVQINHCFKSNSDKCINYSMTATSSNVKILLIQEGKLKYSDVYSSDSELESNIGTQVSTAGPSHTYTGTDSAPSTSKSNVDSNSNKTPDLKHGTYVLVKLETERKKGQQKEHRYVAVCQTDKDQDDEIKVMFLKSTPGDETKLFVADETDVSYVHVNEIVNILSDPTIKQSGNRIFYEFPENAIP